jgi:hypothetical protein
MLKGFYEQVRQERMEQKKLRRTLKIIVISFYITNCCDVSKRTNAVKLGKKKQ